jgi:hypothetical protein
MLALTPPDQQNIQSSRSGAMVVVDDLVDVVDVKPAGAVRIDRVGDVLEQAGAAASRGSRPRARGRRGAQTWNPRPKDC